MPCTTSRLLVLWVTPLEVISFVSGKEDGMGFGIGNDKRHYLLVVAEGETLLASSWCFHASE